ADRAGVRVDRGADGYAVEGGDRGGRAAAAVRAAAGGGRRVGDPGVAEDGAAEYGAGADRAGLAGEPVFDVGDHLRLRYVLCAVCVHVHVGGAEEHGPVARGSGGDVGRL